MGLVNVYIKLTNTDDLALAHRDLLPRAQVRLEDMDLVVHPAEERLVPAHPEGPVKPIRSALKYED